MTLSIQLLGRIYDAISRNGFGEDTYPTRKHELVRWLGWRMSKPNVYLLAGGRPSSREAVFPLIHTVLGGYGIASPTVAYTGTANGDDENFFQRIADTLVAAGAGKVNHAVISSDKADLQKTKEILSSADIVFISGGDVDEGIRVLEEKGMITFLRGLYEEGKPFFGRSAGSIMLAKCWVRWSDPNMDSTATLFPCLGFAPIVCDTHGEQDDWEELRVALELTKDGEKGYGIVSGTAIKVYTDGRVEALGGAVHQFVNNNGKVIRLPNILPVV